MRPGARKPASAPAERAHLTDKGRAALERARRELGAVLELEGIRAELHRIGNAQERIAAAAEAQAEQAASVAAFILAQAKRHAAALGLELDDLPPLAFRGRPRN